MKMLIIYISSSSKLTDLCNNNDNLRTRSGWLEIRALKLYFLYQQV